MHIFIIEAALTGHHSIYLEHIANAYLEAGHAVTVSVLQGNATHPTINRLKTCGGGSFNLVTLDESRYQRALRSNFGQFGRAIATRRLFREIFQDIHQRDPIDYVFIPYLDYCLYAFGLLVSPFGSIRWGGICMRPSFHYQECGVTAPSPKYAGLKRALFLRLLKSKTLDTVFTIDELLQRYITIRNGSLKSRLQYLPDPAELSGSHNPQSARRTLNIPHDSMVVLVYGAIDNRKGLDALIKAINSPALPSDIHLLIVGSQSDSIQEMMKSQSVESMVQERRVHVINRFVDNAEQHAAFVAANVVWLGYRNHYNMSGVLVMATRARRPVLATQEGLIGWYTKQKYLGLVVDINHIESVRTALLCLYNNSDFSSYSRSESSVFDNNTWARFKELLLAELAKL